MPLKRAHWFLSIVLLLALLAACAPAAAPVTQAPNAAASTTAPSSSSKLRVWIEWGDNPAQLQGLFDKYTQKSGVPVEVNAGVVNDKILAALTSSEPPDIIVLSGGDAVKSLAKENVVLQLNDTINSSGIDLNDFYPASLIQCKQGDVIWCLPWGADIYALYWNKDLFEEAGLDPEKPPKTMEELVEYADKLTKKEADGKLSQIGFIPDFSWSHSDLYSRMMGGYWVSEDSTKITVDSDPVIASLKWAQQFYTKYGKENVLSFTTALGEYQSPDQGFYAGKVAMMVDGEWQVGPNFISKYKPELNYGVAAFPPPADHPERANTAVVQGSVTIIPSGVKDKTASAKLLAWMMSPDIIAEEMAANSNLPTSKKAAEDPRFKTIQHFDLFINLMGDKNATAVLNTPITREMTEAFGQVEEKVIHNAEDPTPLLHDLQKTMEAKLQEVMSK